MPPQTTHNCHYISRFLTRPWEGDQQFLRFYDFEADRFGRRSSRSLFAEEDVNTPAVERRLRDVIETPLGAIRARVARGEYELLQRDWERYRAALLLLWLQGSRVRAVREETARQALDRLAAMPEAELNGFAMAMTEIYDLRLVHTEITETGAFAPLVFPSTGLFPFSVQDPSCLSGRSFGLGLAIDVHCAIVATPVERKGRIDMSNARAILASCSIAASPARHVVLMPAHYDQLGERVLRERLRAMRASNDLVIKLAQQAREIVCHAARETGLEPTIDGSGRIVALRAL